jgi:hypothetical protein
MFEGRTLQDAIADAGEQLETELRMTDARIRGIGWDTATSHQHASTRPGTTPGQDRTLASDAEEPHPALSRPFGDSRE